MRKQNKSFNPLGTQKFFKNVGIDKKFNPIKTYYSFIEIDGKEHIFTVEEKFRSVAEEHFKQQARLHNGKYTTLYALRK